MTDVLPVRGARVVLRRCAAGDLEAFLAYRGDPAVARFQDWAAMTRAEVGITLARAAQGGGRATEAVRLAVALILARTEAQVIHGIADIRNAPSLAMLTRAGFRAVREQTTTEGGETFTERFHVIER